MAISTRLRLGLNRALSVFNLQLQTLTSERRERERLRALGEAGLFSRQLYSLLPGMAEFDTSTIEMTYSEHAASIERLRTPDRNDVGFDARNPYFPSPDFEILYSIVASLRPKLIVEVGCGNSTRVIRQAIIDQDLPTKIVAVDPSPRSDVLGISDHIYEHRIEEIEDYSIFYQLDVNDVLFIDSSHMVHLGSDVARIFCDIIPKLKRGVVVHVHDIFLPFEYPEDRVELFARWGEQYILHALLQSGAGEILWPGYFIQKTRPDVIARLPFLSHGTAQSFWFRLG